MYKVLTVIAMLLTVALCKVVINNHALKAENERLEANAAVLMSKATHYETKAGKSAASAQKLTLDYKELQSHYAHVCRAANELGIKVKRLQAASSTATRTEVKIVTQVRDSIVYRDGMLDSLKMLHWQDPWVTVDGELRGDSAALDVISCDTITQIIHRVPKKFWFIKWGCKAIRQEVVSSNPHSKITWTEYIEVK